MRALALLTFVMLGGCAASAGAVANATLNTAVAAGVAGVRRANGDCYTICNPGTTCNKETGMCDPIRCGGKCQFDEKCETTYTGDKCVPARPLP
ncbi:MAG: hypothetical protein ACOZQL_29700 [Myxococcota bacterium]